MENEKVKFYLSNNWSIIIETDYEQIDNGDSWQAYKDEQIIYVSTLKIKDKYNKVSPVGEIRDISKKKFVGKKQFSFEEGQRLGAAELNRINKGWQLDAFMCTNGNLAICVINFKDETALNWALDVWKSLSHDNDGE
jgi:hypothetical protein